MSKPPVSATDAREDIARVVTLSGRAPRQALRLAQRLLARRPRLAADDRARLWRAQGHALRGIGDYAGARLAYHRSRRTFERLGLTDEWALGAIGLIDACMYLARPDEAAEAGRTALAVFRRRGDRRRMAMIATNLGNLFHRSDRMEQAIEHYDQAAELLAEGSAVERAMVDHNRANVFILLGRRSESRAAFERACAVFEANGEPVLAAQTRYGLACLRFLSGEYAAAITELERVRPQLQALGARSLLALADLDLAEVLLSIRLLPEAVSLARSAARWFGAHRVPTDRARCLLVSGSALAQFGETRAAERDLTAAARAFAAHGFATGLAAVALSRAQSALRSGRPAEAARHARESMRVFGRAGLGLRSLAAGALAAESLLAGGRGREARTLARTLRRGAARPGDAYSRARLARVEGAAAAQAGDPRAALAHYEEALAQSERAQSSLFVDEWRVGFLEGEPALLDEALGVLLRQRPEPRAASVWRWLATTAGGRARGVRVEPPGISSEVKARAQEIREQLEACYGRLWQRHAVGGARRLAVVPERELERRTLALEGQLRRLAAAPRLRSAGERAADAPRLRRHELELRYFSASGRLGALLRDAAGGVRMVRDLAPLTEAERHLRLFHYQMDLMSRGEPSLREHRPRVEARAESHLAALSALLLQPVLGDAPPPRALRIHTHGALARIPWHALPHHGRRLAESAEVTLAPLAPVRPGAPRRGALVLGVGDATTLDIEREARDVARALSGSGPVTLLLGGAATREAALRAMQSAALIHVAGHALYRAEHPEFSAVRLHDGWLHARDLAALDLRGAAVVLSACETGPRAAVAGETVLGLVRGFTQAGASCTLSSLWRVDDAATRGFMRGLYAAWREHGALGAALRHEQAAAAGAGHALHGWAAFTLIGEPGAMWPGGTRERGAGE